MVVAAMVVHGQLLEGYTHIKGVVTDSVTGERMPYAQVFLLGSQTGALTNEQGGFTIVTGVKFDKLRVFVVGYEPKEINVPIGKYTELDIKLVPTTVMLNEIIVRKTA